MKLLQKKITLLVAAFCACAAPVFAATEKTPGNIVFIGDSITNGGKYLAGPVASYRYQVFKAFVDNDVKFSPMGMTRGAAWQTDVSALTPNYRGEKFENVSEAAASGRAYQYAGHSNEKMSSGRDYKGDPGTAHPAANRGPVTLKLGQPNPFIKDKKDARDSFYDGTKLKKYTGDTYKSLYGNKKVDTLCILIGINDLYDAWEPHEKIAEHIQNIVSAYQKHNPAVRVHVFELLPTGADNGTGTHGKNNFSPYNEYLRGIVSRWSKGKSVVTCDDIAQGFYAEDGSMIDTSRGAHPNAQGELIVGGNIARVLGVGQRTAGLKRLTPDALPIRINLADAAKKKGWKLDAKKRLTLSTDLSGGSDFRREWKNAKSTRAHPFTAAFKFKMNETGRSDNMLGIICGNGADAGLLLVSESGIYWNDTKTLLYGSKPGIRENKVFTKKPVKIRIVWKQKDETEGGFYVWLEDQLIGEALKATSDTAVTNNYKNTFLIGDLGNDYAVNATISEISLDGNAAYAPPANNE